MKTYLRRALLVLVASLLVAVPPAVASADTAVPTPANVQQQSASEDTTVAPGDTGTANTGNQAAPAPPAGGTDTVTPAATGAGAGATGAATSPNTAAHGPGTATATSAAAAAAPQNNSNPNAVTSTTSTTNSPVTQDQQSAHSMQSQNAKTTTAADTSIQNTVRSSATTGDATVNNNDRAGNATSGDASANITAINSLQSTSAFTGGTAVATFTTDITGDQTGDLLLDPSLIATLPVMQSPAPTTDLIVKSSNTATITNDIQLTATSGSARVTNNDSAGNAKSGGASAVANIINIVNSVVGANKTFIGTINITGDLTGDILVPDELKNMLNAQSAAPGTTLGVANQASTAIANTVTTEATSGQASVRNNGQAGNAASGNAATNVTVMNLTGHELSGANSVVVFVNILGSWVGFIVDAPQDARVAALGNGITKNQVNSGTASIQNNADTAITNAVTVRSASGDAQVANNGHAGNATSGNASASANILNMTNSNLSLGGWFGILFINVMGSWHGSFGVDTAAGGYSTHQGTSDADSQQTGQPNKAGSSHPANASPPTTPVTPRQGAIQAGSGSASSQNDSQSITQKPNDSARHTAVLSAHAAIPQPSVSHMSRHSALPALGMGASALLFAGEIFRSRRRRT